MLRKIRIAAAAVFFTMITLLFLDFTGTLHAWFGWMARVQLLPAVLAVNVAVVAALLVLTLLFGRVYCSVICPLGVFQDVASWAGGKRRKNRFTYSRALPWLRYGMLALFVAAMVAHIKPVAELLAPYSAYGRIASNLFAPLYRWGNNLLAYAAERIDSYAFYTVDVWVKSGVTFAVAAATFAVLAVLAWRNGRTYCNTVCPVGTILGFVSRFAVFKPRIDTSKCNGCGLCARNCKASCIDAKSHEIDYSRCVACMDCIGKCRQHAIAFSRKPAAKPASETSASAAAETPAKTDRGVAAESSSKADRDVAAESSSKAERVVAADRPADPSRRKFLTIAGVLAYTATVRAQEKKVDGGLALIEDKKVPDRAAGIAGGPQLDGALYRVSAVRGGVSQSGVAPLRQADDPDAARNVVRARLLPARMYEVFRSVSHGGHPSDHGGREVGDADRPCRVDRRQLRRQYRRRGLRQLRTPLSHGSHSHGA